MGGPRITEPYFCGWCGERFKPHDRKSRFCSRICSSRYAVSVRDLSGKRNPNAQTGPDYEVDDCGCWVWSHGRTAAGYGVAPGNQLGHRVYYERFVGPIPEGLELDHLCRNRACVNPDHLEAVTHAENMRRGANTKLAPEDVVVIRASNEPHRVLAERYGLHVKYVGMVRRGEYWKEAA